MTVTLNLTPEIEAGLSMQAQQSGMDLENYLLTLVEKAALPATDVESRSDREMAVHRMLEFGKKHRLSLAEPITRSLMHEDHRF